MVASLGQANSERILGFASVSLELHLIVDYWTTFGPEFEADSCACSRLKSVVWKLVAAGLPIKLRILQTWETGQPSPQPVTAAALERFLSEQHQTSPSRKTVAPIVVPLKCWREANNLSQAEAVRALASADVPAKLATLRQWEIGRALARCDHDRRPPEISG